MEFRTIAELAAQAERDGACRAALASVRRLRNRKLQDFIDTCPPDWRNWALHHHYTQFMNERVAKSLNGWRWAILLIEHPQFAHLCDWTKLNNGWNWADLLSKQPQFSAHCDWSTLDGWNWSHLLEAQPQFANLCDWSRLNSTNWAQLLEVQPQFADARRKEFANA